MTTTHHAHDLGRRVAERLRGAPEDPAVLGPDPLTNGELDRLSGACADRLRALGVGPGTTVALDAGLGSRFPVALVAVLATGAAYTALDFTDPAAVARTTAALSADVWIGGADRTPPGRTALALDPAAPPGRTAPALDPAAPPGRAGRAGRPGTHPGPDPQDAFQAVFTSGSLGRPKCVTTTYAAVANRLDWFLETYPLLPGDVVAVHKDVSLVGSPVEILTGLLGGAALCFLDRDTLLDPDELWEAVEEHRVSHLLASPPVLELLLASAPPAGGGAALRLAASSAQGLSADLAGRWRRRFPRTRLLNMYGLTETASNVSCFEVTDDSPGHGGTVPVGHPIPGCRIHLLGPGGHPVPAGETGEIHLGGVCLARGYTGPDGDTAARFVPGPPPGRERLFRTGDTGRWTDRGLEVLGRTDTQIKIRGYKVMPEEVEALLSALPDVTGAAALAVGDPLDARELVAFVEGPAGVDTAAAARALAQQLPAAARPSRIVQVARIPRTASGKVDRVRLPELLDAPAPAAPPPTASCAAVVEAVWKRVLEVEQAGPDDDFFQTLGGHSLKATSAIAALRRELGVKVPLRMIFDRPVLADFVTALDAFTAERGARAGA